MIGATVGRDNLNITSTIIGARKLSQLEDNLRALEFELTQQQVQALNSVSEPALISPYSYHTEQMQSLIHTGTTIRKG